MEDKIRTEKRKMKSGPDNISEGLEDYGVDKITTLLNKIHDTGQNNLIRHLHIYIYNTVKDTRATECKFWMKISLMSHITKKSF